MAFTEKKDNGKFQGRYRNADGHKRSAGIFTQRKQALKEAQRLEDEQSQPGAPDRDGAKTTWGDWFAQLQQSRIVSYATHTNYTTTAKNHVLPYWQHVRLSDIEPLAVSKWVKTLHDRGASPYTIRNALTLFKTTLNEAVRQNWLLRNPANGVRQPDMPDRVQRFLTREEVDAVALHLGGVHGLVFWTAVLTGMRFGEIAGLHWSRVDLDRGVIEVVEKFDQKAKRIDPVPKDREKRTVPLPPNLIDMLRRHRDHHMAQVTTRTCDVPHSAGRCPGGNLVFRGRRNAVLKSNTWKKSFLEPALDLAGITDRVRVHDLRHTYASWLIQRGVPLPDIARVMGHSDVEVSRLYAHLDDSGYEKVRQALTAAVDDGPRSDGPAEINSALQRPRRANWRANPGDTPLHLVTPDEAPDAG